MRKFQLHPLSVIAGLALAGFVGLTTSQSFPSPATLNPASIRIEYMPHPRDMIQIPEGTPYTVPVGKIFVLTALGTPNSGINGAELRVDGVAECYSSAVSNGPACTPRPVSQGFSVAAGRVISVTGGVTGRAWGYLANE